MTHKWIGAILVIAGCGGAGFGIASGYRREANILRQLLRIIEYMECELQYNLTPLPDLCRKAVKDTKGVLQDVFQNLARELDWQISPDAYSCMIAALRKSPEVPSRAKKILLQLGRTLGRFDLNGQVMELSSAYASCETELSEVEQDKSDRLRSYQTLGLCAGAALAILFI